MKRRLDYDDYIRGPEWAGRRHEACKAAHWRCEVCNQPSLRLEVHHKNYDRLGEELPSDLMVLCHECHKEADKPWKDKRFAMEHIGKFVSWARSTHPGVEVFAPMLTREFRELFGGNPPEVTP